MSILSPTRHMHNKFYKLFSSAPRILKPQFTGTRTEIKTNFLDLYPDGTFLHIFV